jgi:hypothetical protein
MYIRMRATLSNTLLAWGRLITFLFGEPASRFTSATTFGNMEEGKIATACNSFAIERSQSMYIRMRVLPWE